MTTQTKRTRDLKRDRLAGYLAPPTPRERAARTSRSGLFDSPDDARVFGYARVSTDAQAEDGESLDVQRRQLEGWAMQHGRAIDAVHIEAGVSGAVPFAERPEGGKLWTELRKGDVLVAAKLDRMFRSALDCLTVVEAFKTRGVSLWHCHGNEAGDRSGGGREWWHEAATRPALPPSLPGRGHQPCCVAVSRVQPQPA